MDSSYDELLYPEKVEEVKESAAKKKRKRWRKKKKLKVIAKYNHTLDEPPNSLPTQLSLNVCPVVMTASVFIHSLSGVLKGKFNRE